MNDSSHFAFIVVLASLLGSPIMAAVLSWRLSRNSVNIQRKVFFTLASYVSFVIFVTVLGLSIRSYKANLVLHGFTYLCFCVLALSAFRLKPRVLGVSLGILGSLPLMVGLLLGTVGILGIAFIIGDSIPIYAGSNKDTTCYVNSFGNATTKDGGYDVTIKKQLPVITFIERTIQRERFINPAFLPSDACK